MSMARLNLSHGTLKNNTNIIRNYYRARKLRPFKTCSLMLDLVGRQIRTSKLSEPAEGIAFEMGDSVNVTCETCVPSNKETIQIDMMDLSHSLRPGDLIGFNDGELGAVVLEVTEFNIKVQFKDGGVVLPHKQIRIPGHRLSALPILRDTDKKAIITLALPYKMDYVCIPNVTSAKDIQDAKQARTPEGEKLAIIARIDNLEAVH